MNTLLLAHSLKKPLLLSLALIIAGCASQDSKPAKTQPTTQNRVEDLEIVDCLLPGQTRQLGDQIYITARRPARLTAADCRIRGGEYVAYDRADYKTALKVWLPSAESGDAEAQANVGEIFEQGLGGQPNYQAAALWYQKAADQGNKRAQFNLATLYEQGLGVPQDKLVAMNYYRKAWGLPEDSLVYQSAVDEQQKQQEASLKQAIAQKDSQLRLLQNQVASLKADLVKQKNNPAINQQVADLNALVASLQTANQESKQKLASIQAQRESHKVRTVINKETPVFKSQGIDVISKDINFGKYYALVIGVQDYDHVPKLDTPVNDINAVADVLSKKYGFTVQKVVNADNISIMEAINNLNQKLGENDNLLIFFAGHGVRTGHDAQEVGYWLPVNADAPPRDTNWLPNEFVTRHLANLKAKRVLVVSDSCYAGLLSPTPDFLILNNQQNNVKFLEYKASKRSRLLLASGGDNPVLDSDDGKNSIFTRVFVNVLENNQHILTGPELYKALRDEVVKESKAANFEQEPEYRAIKGAGHEAGGFFFIPQASKTL